MTVPKSLPARPSQESLRKQAKKLARDIATGNAAGIARARAQLPKAELPLSQRDAQLVIAREYGFPGWQQLIAEVQKRLGPETMSRGFFDVPERHGMASLSLRFTRQTLQRAGRVAARSVENAMDDPQTRQRSTVAVGPRGLARTDQP